MAAEQPTTAEIQAYVRDQLAEDLRTLGMSEAAATELAERAAAIDVE